MKDFENNVRNLDMEKTLKRATDFANGMCVAVSETLDGVCGKTRIKLLYCSRLRLMFQIFGMRINKCLQ